MLAEKSSFFIVILGLFCFFFSPIQAQFSAGPQDINSTAIHKNDTSFSFWANNITVKRGWQNIADTTLGKANFGIEDNVIGISNNATISLGDAGFAIIEFPFAIKNVNGYDFAVFENGFAQNESPENEYFLELAIIEVSENGTDFIQFESTSNTSTNYQIGTFEQLNCTKINNLAGKYPANYGTPFDIEELGLDSIVAIKIIDVIGTIDSSFATFDSQGNIINDPYPTAFGSSGFDLDAVGALNQPNQDTITNVLVVDNEKIKIYPNPIKQNNFFYIESIDKIQTLKIYSILGELIFTTSFKNIIKIETNNVEKGIYFIRIDNKSIMKLIIN